MPLDYRAERADGVTTGLLQHRDGSVDDAVAADGNVAVEDDKRISAKWRAAPLLLLRLVHRVKHDVLDGSIARRQVWGAGNRLESVSLGELADRRAVGRDHGVSQGARG